MLRRSISRTYLTRAFGVLCWLATVGISSWLFADDTSPESKWEKEIQRFELSDRLQPVPRGATLFAGSSSIRLWKTLENDFPGLVVINRGFGGSQISDSTRFAERIIIPCKPKQIVLYAGDNDIAAGLPPEQVRQHFGDFVGKIHRALPDTRIVFISIKPSLSRWHLVEKIRTANKLIADDCKGNKRLLFVDIFHPMLGPDGSPNPALFVEDGLHLSQAGYALWAERLRRALAE